jgi:DNA-binding transcriptional MerR regulator
VVGMADQEEGAISGPAPKGLWTSAQVAAHLGVSVRLIQRHRAEGTLVPTMETPKGHARWDIEDVQRQLRALRESRTDKR